MNDIVARLQIYTNGRFRFNHILGEGSYGVVYSCFDQFRSEEVALKVFGTKKLPKDKFSEYEMLKELQDTPGIPKIYDHFEYPDLWAFSMELLGPNLGQIHARYQPFSLRTVSLIGLQLLDTLEQVHNKGFVHRDIKPANIMVGGPRFRSSIYLIDYGVSRKFFNDNQNMLGGTGHLSPRQRSGLIGTARFASIHSHMNMEVSRRDDLESMLYVLIFIYRGELEWSKIDFKPEQDRDSIFQAIKDMKISTPASAICKGMSEHFRIMLEYVRNLNFKEQPAYSAMRRMFNGVLEQEAIHDSYGRPLKFEWETANSGYSPYSKTVAASVKRPTAKDLSLAFNEYGLPQPSNDKAQTLVNSTSRQAYERASSIQEKNSVLLAVGHRIGQVSSCFQKKVSVSDLVKKTPNFSSKNKLMQHSRSQTVMQTTNTECYGTTY